MPYELTPSIDYRTPKEICQTTGDAPMNSLIFTAYDLIKEYLPSLILILSYVSKNVPLLQFRRLVAPTQESKYLDLGSKPRKARTVDRDNRV
jgi:hypothetical protein